MAVPLLLHAVQHSEPDVGLGVPAPPANRGEGSHCRAVRELYGNINGASGQISVWLDGTPVAQLTGTQSLGTNAIGYLQLGDTSTTDSFDTVFDDVQADPSFITP